MKAEKAVPAIILIAAHYSHFNPHSITTLLSLLITEISSYPYCDWE